MRTARLRVFVYGTLKQGERNHLPYCRGAALIEPAQVRGQLYFLPFGYPMLVVPALTILAHGTADPDADLATQLRFDEVSAGDSQQRNASLHRAPAPRGDWDAIDGEVISFASADEPLAQLDALEDFVAGNPTNSYERVLVPLLGERQSVAWTYCAPPAGPPSFARRIGCRWP